MKKRKSSLARISAFRHSDIEQYRELGVWSLSTNSSKLFTVAQFLPLIKSSEPQYKWIKDEGLSDFQDLASGGLNGINRYGSLTRASSQLQLDSYHEQELVENFNWIIVTLEKNRLVRRAFVLPESWTDTTVPCEQLFFYFRHAKSLFSKCKIPFSYRVI